MQPSIVVRVTAVRQSVPADGPVGVRIEVVNAGATPLQLDWTYPAPPGLSMDSPGPGAHAQPGAEGTRPSHRFVPLVLAPSEATAAVHQVRRYLRFDGPGRYQVAVRVQIHARPLDARGAPVGEYATTESVTQVTLVLDPPARGETRRALDEAASHLTGGTPGAQAEAVELLTHLDTPEALPYLQRVLALPEHRAEAFRALGRIGTPDALALVERHLPGSDLPQLDAGLGVLARAHRAVAVPTLRALLKGASDGAAWACLSHLLEVGGRQHAPEVTPLSRSTNPELAKLARQFLEKVKRAP